LENRYLNTSNLGFSSRLCCLRLVLAFGTHSRTQTIGITYVG
jgi:hypothetical protein